MDNGDQWSFRPNCMVLDSRTQPVRGQQLNVTSRIGEQRVKPTFGAFLSVSVAGRFRASVHGDSAQSAHRPVRHFRVGGPHDRSVQKERHNSAHRRSGNRRVMIRRLEDSAHQRFPVLSSVGHWNDVQVRCMQGQLVEFRRVMVKRTVMPDVEVAVLSLFGRSVEMSLCLPILQLTGGVREVNRRCVSAMDRASAVVSSEGGPRASR